MPMMLSSHSKGIKFALITALISGVSIFVNKFAVGAFGQPLAFTAFKNTLVAVFLIGIILGAGKYHHVKFLSKKEKLYLLLIGLIGGSIPFYLFFTGISQIPAINAAMIHKTLVIWVIILAVPILKERISKLQILAIALLFSSNLVIGGFRGFLFSTGELMILAATVLWAVETIIAKKVLPSVDPDIVAASRMVIGAVVLLGAALLTAPSALGSVTGLSLAQWVLVLVTVLFLLGYVTSWYRALKFAPAIVVTAVLVSSTLVTNILTATFVTHTWNIPLTIQTILIMGGVGLLLVSDKKQVTSKASV
jgi:drug/metabolite transporter (DMT)-like permease